MADPASLNFGETWQTRQFKWPIRLMNRSLKELRVKSWKTDCDCQDIRPASAFIPPNAELTIEATIDLTRHERPSNAEPEDRAVTYHFRPEFEDGPGDEEFVVQGVVKPFHRPIEPIFFGTHSEASGPILSRSREVTFLFPVGEVRLVATKNVAGRVEAISPTTARVWLDWNTVPPVGDHLAEVAISAKTADGYLLPPLPVAGRVNVVEDLEVSPARVSFLSTDVRTDIQYVEVRSRTGAALTIHKIQNPAPDALKVEWKTGPRVGVLPVRWTAGQHTIYIRATSGTRAYMLAFQVVVG